MESVPKLMLCAIGFVCTLAAQTAPPFYVVHGNCKDGLPTYQQWLGKTQLAQGKPYFAGLERRRQILENYSKLTSQMTLEQVEHLLGGPDFSQPSARGHLSNQPELAPPICTDQVAYVLQKKSGNMADMNDVAIYMVFSPENKLTWVAPQNVPGLKTIGGPTQ